MRNFWSPLLPSLKPPPPPSYSPRPRSSLLPTSVMPSYLCLQSHWDNCTPIMEKLVGPEMSLSPSLSLSALRSNAAAHLALPHQTPTSSRRKRRDHRCEASSTNELSLFSFLPSSSLCCACFLLEYHFNVALQVFYDYKEKYKIKWNKKRCGSHHLKKVTCLGFFICPWKHLYHISIWFL